MVDPAHLLRGTRAARLHVWWSMLYSWDPHGGSCHRGVGTHPGSADPSSSSWTVEEEVSGGIAGVDLAFLQIGTGSVHSRILERRVVVVVGGSRGSSSGRKEDRREDGRGGGIYRKGLDGKDGWQAE